jgi:NADP-dependent 3-hydroxy acid dehydrogenase YdfG
LAEISEFGHTGAGINISTNESKELSMSSSSIQSLSGKVIIITGASSGLGEATARRLAGRGAKLVLAARRADRLQAIAAELSADGADVAVLATDVTDMVQVQALADFALKNFGRIDVLVNNAGIMPLAPLSKLKVDEWSRMIDVNIKGVLHGVAAVLPTMTAQADGHIINIASVAGHKLFTPIGTVYSATKFAVRALSEGLRAEAPAGVRTTIVSPGAVESELKLGSSDAESAAGVQAFYQANQISADSVARAIVYAIEQPVDVDINEIVLRPTVQDF